MDFTAHFFWYSLLSFAVATLWFSLPGLWVLRHLGFQRFPSLLVAPALGLCTFGPFSLGFTAILGYSTFTLILSWVLFQIGLWLTQPSIPSKEAFYPTTLISTSLLILGMVLWALLTTSQIYPALYQDGLFVNTPIFDHAKVALVDAIARQGLLPINPYYAPEGETIPLIYYYTWHFLASQLKLLTPVSGWQAEIAMNALTAIATLGFLSALAMRLTQQVRAGIWVILLAFAGLPLDLLPDLFGQRLQNWLTIPPGHGLEVLWIQMIWVPQHVFSALAIVMVLFLLSRALTSHWQPRLATIMGLVTASAFGASTWVGGIAFVFISPALLLVVFSLRLPRPDYWQILKTLSLALGICVLFAIPLLISQSSGPSLGDSVLPFGLGLFPATRLFDRTGLEGKIAHALLFWLQFLPLNLGIIYVIGLPALFARSFSFWERSPVTETRLFHAFSVVSVIGYLLITQFIKSTFWNNSFGWRAVLVPVMLLSIWSVVALVELVYGQQFVQWRTKAWLVRFRGAILPVTLVGLTIGWLSTIRVWHLPDPRYSPPTPEILALHQGFLRQYHAWTKVREYAGPADRVQANPDGYAKLTPWPATLPYALFADRPTAYANVEYTTVFAYRYDQAKNAQQYQLIQEIFSEQPSMVALKKLRDTLKVKVLLVDRFDLNWINSQLIDQSGIYRLIYEEVDFKIYLAII